MAKRVFIIENRRNGSKAGYWAPDTRIHIVPSGAPGRVGEICDAMRKGPDCITRPPPTKWTPPVDYEFVARHLPEAERTAYLARCEAWHRENPPKDLTDTVAYVKPWAWRHAAPHMPDPDAYTAKWSTWFKEHKVPVQKDIDLEPILALSAKYPTSRPPLGEKLRAMHKAGYSAAHLERTQAYYEWCEEVAGAQQKLFDIAFAQWPSAGKSAPKPKKVIKAVKKRPVKSFITDISNEQP
jgi:hypothetical protein